MPAQRGWLRYRESGQRLESLAYQRRHLAWNALHRSTREEIQRLHGECPHWSAPAIAEALAGTEGVVVHRATVHRHASGWNLVQVHIM